MFDDFLRERLSKKAYMLYLTLAILAIFWHAYCLFDKSGIVGWLNQLQTVVLDGRYFQALSLVIAALLTSVPAAGIGFLYDALFSSKQHPQ